MARRIEEEHRGVNIIIIYGMTNYRREYDEHHEGYDHSAHTYERYNLGVYGRDDCNGSYGDEPKVQRRIMDSEDIAEHGGHFTFFNSLGTYLERKYFVESNSISCASRVNGYDFNIANFDSCVLGVEDRRSMEKELGPILEDIAIRLSLNLSSLGSIDVSSVIFDSSCYGFDNLDGTSLVELNIVGFALGFDKNSLQHVCTITSMRGRRHTMEFEGQGKSVRGKLILCYGDLTMSFSSKPISLLLCVFLQRVKIVLRIECVLCDFGWGLSS
ncbi:hypothetical protein M9H77_07302 [Catharanthus roseus]|uniref:Uncharacterized protein n=1 Tax=Catharanthus roseus TaxID=4058 RepID=A0ACC0BUT2_CATRO|nr:hypothetical protein M9H77_07302 [Catharanthus roseus]